MPIPALDPADSDFILPIPEGLSLRLGDEMFLVSFPIPDCLEARPIGNGNADAVGAANRFNAEKAGLLRSEREHLLGHFAIAVFALGALRGEDHGVIRRFGSCSDRVHIHCLMVVRAEIATDRKGDAEIDRADQAEAGGGN